MLPPMVYIAWVSHAVNNLRNLVLPITALSRYLTLEVGAYRDNLSSRFLAVDFRSTCCWKNYFYLTVCIMASSSISPFQIHQGY